MPDSNMRIGEVAERAAVTVEAIRFYERKGLLENPGRSPAGYRLYEKGVLDQLRFIKKARRLGLSLAEIHEIFTMAQGGEVPCCRVRELLADRVAELDRKIVELEELRIEVQEFVDSIAGLPDQSDSSESVCALIETVPLVKRGGPRARRPSSKGRPRG